MAFVDQLHSLLVYHLHMYVYAHTYVATQPESGGRQKK